MKFKAALLAASAAFASTAIAEPIPVDAYARKPAITSVSMSDEGDFVVGLITPPGDDGEELALAVWDLEKGGPPVVTPANDRMKFSWAQALKSGKLFVGARQAWTGSLNGCGEGRSTGNTKTYLRKTYITSTEMKDFDEAFKKNAKRRGQSAQTRRCFDLLSTAGLVRNLPLEPNDVIVQRLNTGNFQTEYYRVNLRNGREEMIYREGSEGANLFDPRDGELLVKSKVEPIGGDYELQTLIKNPDTGEFENQPALANKLSDRYNVSVVGRDEETGKYYVVTDMFDQTADVYFYDVRTKSFDDEALFGLEKFDATGVVLGSTEENFNQLLGFSYAAETGKVYWLDPEVRSLYAGLEKAFPGQTVSIDTIAKGGDRILFSTQSSAHPPSYHLLIDKKAVQTLGNERPWIEPDNLRQDELVYYTARDGMRVPALLTLPKGFKPGEDAPIPAIVHPHGGPWARDFAGWDSSGWTQYFASRGYAVIRPQFRGSAGWGRDLWLAGDGEWGQKMQDDKDDAATWMVEQGIADPDKIAIHGYSYGGFAAFAATVRENSPYQCAIAGAGVSNLAAIQNTWGANRFQRIFQGRTVKGMDPLRNTDKANIPILVLHGDRDVRVPLFHGTDFYDAVKNDVPSKLVVLDDMGHQGDLWTNENTRDYLTEMESFLNGECGMQTAASASGQEGGRGD